MRELTVIPSEGITKTSTNTIITCSSNKIDDGQLLINLINFDWM